MRAALIASLLLLTVRAAFAQEQTDLYQFAGTSFLGHSVVGVGDVDRDGHPDFMACAFAYQKGYADVRSGIDGALIFHIKSSADYFGEYAAGGGDVNADGYPDF